MIETTSLADALAKVQAKLPEVKKSSRANVPTKQGGEFSYTYADLAEISSKILPLLGEHGLSFTAKPTFSIGDKFVLAYSLLHVSGEREDGEYPLPSGVSPQATGSAITYARRYTLCAITGLAPEDDDDDAAQAAAEVKASSGPVRRQQAKPQRNQAAATVQRRPQQQPDDLPPLPGDSEERPIGRPGSITGSQQTRLHALLTGLGFDSRKDRDKGLAVVEQIAGRVLTGPHRARDDSDRTTKNLSMTEAGKVIGLLDEFGGSRELLDGHLAGMVKEGET